MNNEFKFRFALLIIIVGLVCCGCNGSITRDIRHAGFAIGGTFECNVFYPSDKEDTSYEKIRYITDTHIINSEGKIYEFSSSQKYVNNQNCKVADTEVRVKAIFDNRVIKGTDNKYYNLIGQDGVTPYSEISDMDNSYAIYDLLLKEDDVVKVVTANSGTGIFYILKKDGNVYSYEVTKQNYESPPLITSISIVYDKSVYGSDILDFNYAGQSFNTFIKTDEKVFRMKITNLDQCSKYADIACRYTIQEDSLFEEKKDYILAYNGNLLITTYKQEFTVNSN